MIVNDILALCYQCSYVCFILSHLSLFLFEGLGWPRDIINTYNLKFLGRNQETFKLTSSLAFHKIQKSPQRLEPFCLQQTILLICGPLFPSESCSNTLLDYVETKSPQPTPQPPQLSKHFVGLYIDKLETGYPFALLYYFLLADNQSINGSVVLYWQLQVINQLLPCN